MDKPKKIRIGGIKFSEELVHITAKCDRDSANTMPTLLQLIAEKHINIPFLCYSTTKNTPKTCFCVGNGDFEAVQQILNTRALQSTNITVVPSVGTFTIFPHRNSFDFIGQILKVINELNFPLYSLSTSISALAFATDYHLLDQLAEKLATIVELPENHAPFRQEFQLKQIQP